MIRSSPKSFPESLLFTSLTFPFVTFKPAFYLYDICSSVVIKILTDLTGKLLFWLDRFCEKIDNFLEDSLKTPEFCILEQ